MERDGMNKHLTTIVVYLKKRESPVLFLSLSSILRLLSAVPTRVRWPSNPFENSQKKREREREKRGHLKSISHFFIFLLVQTLEK